MAWRTRESPLARVPQAERAELTQRRRKTQCFRPWERIRLGGNYSYMEPTVTSKNDLPEFSLIYHDIFALERNEEKREKRRNISTNDSVSRLRSASRLHKSAISLFDRQCLKLKRRQKQIASFFRSESSRIVFLTSRRVIDRFAVKTLWQCEFSQVSRIGDQWNSVLDMSRITYVCGLQIRCRVQCKAICKTARVNSVNYRECARTRHQYQSRFITWLCTRVDRSMEQADVT